MIKKFPVYHFSDHNYFITTQKKQINFDMQCADFSKITHNYNSIQNHKITVQEKIKAKDWKSRSGKDRGIDHPPKNSPSAYF